MILAVDEIRQMGGSKKGHTNHYSLAAEAQGEIRPPECAVQS
jgi:hypothetical protein